MTLRSPKDRKLTYDYSTLSPTIREDVDEIREMDNEQGTKSKYKKDRSDWSEADEDNSLECLNVPDNGPLSLSIVQNDEC